jgi:RNA polymerase sigma-70 factor (family 1)
MIRKLTRSLHLSNDAQLITRWQLGDVQAFCQLYKTHVIDLLAVAMHKTNNRQSAEELVQNSFVKLLEHRDRLEADTSIKAYLYVILKNQILNYYRHELVEHRYINNMLSSGSERGDSVMDIIETRELEKKLEIEIANLPGKCRTVYVMRRKENMTNREISRILGISENTVEQHMRKAMNRLRNSLANLVELALIIYLFNT